MVGNSLWKRAARKAVEPDEVGRIAGGRAGSPFEPPAGLPRAFCRLVSHERPEGSSMHDL